MAFTAKEEAILKKLIERETKRVEWDSLSKTYLDAVRGATEAERQKQTALNNNINSKHAERQTVETEIKSLIES